MTSWTQHNEMAARQSLPPAETLLQFFSLYEKEGLAAGSALDLGSGAGIDTLALLQRGWQVTAVDKDGDSLAALTARINSSQLQCIHAGFEAMQLPATYQLVNASFSLPFCAPAAFLACWQKVQQAIAPGGYFCGHLFGKRDSWSSRPDVTTHSQQEIASLFTGFDIAWQKEAEKASTTVNGQVKHWHIFAICARKQYTGLSAKQ